MKPTSTWTCTPAKTAGRWRRTGPDPVSPQSTESCVNRYAGVCGECGERREYLFGLPDRPVLPKGYPTFGGEEPSELLDAGEWLWVADLTAGNVPTHDPAEAHRALATAAAAIEEILKFIPPGQDEPPADAFWSDRGHEMRAVKPGSFQLDRLMIVRDTYRDLAAAHA